MNFRLAKPEEAGKAVEWLASTPQNLFDPEVLGYPSSLTFCVENGEPLLYMPLQVTLTMESIGKKPGIRHRDMALSLVQLIEGIYNFAKGANIAEIYFICVEPGIVEQAKHFGFEKVMEDKESGKALFRMKVKNAQIR